MSECACLCLEMQQGNTSERERARKELEKEPRENWCSEASAYTTYRLRKEDVNEKNSYRKLCYVSILISLKVLLQCLIVTRV